METSSFQNSEVHSVFWLALDSGSSSYAATAKPARTQFNPWQGTGIDLMIKATLLPIDNVLLPSLYWYNIEVSVLSQLKKNMSHLSSGASCRPFEINNISLNLFTLLITEGGSCYSPCKAIRPYWNCQKRQLRGKDSLQRLLHLINLISIALFFKLCASMFSYFSLLQATDAADNLRTADKYKSGKKCSSSQVSILTKIQIQSYQHYQWCPHRLSTPIS